MLNDKEKKEFIASLEHDKGFRLSIINLLAEDLGSFFNLQVNSERNMYSESVVSSVELYVDSKEENDMKKLVDKDLRKILSIEFENAWKKTEKEWKTISKSDARRLYVDLIMSEVGSDFDSMVALNRIKYAAECINVVYAHSSMNNDVDFESRLRSAVKHKKYDFHYS